MTVNVISSVYWLGRSASLDLTKVKVAVPSENGDAGCVLGPATSHQSLCSNSKKNSSSEFPVFLNGISIVTALSSTSK